LSSGKHRAELKQKPDNVEAEQKLLLRREKKYARVVLIGALGLFLGVPRNVAVNNMPDSNWAGSGKSTDIANPKPLFTGIKASWIITSPNQSYTRNPDDKTIGQWIGIGGSNPNDVENLIQVGTDCHGNGVCKGFYELLPGPPMEFKTFSVSPGDIVSVEINKVDLAKDLWHIKFEDKTSKLRGNTDLQYSSTQYSAECIFERPLEDDRSSYSRLGSFGATKFFDISYGVDQKYQASPVRDVTYDIVQDGTVITRSTLKGSELDIKDLRR